MITPTERSTLDEQVNSVATKQGGNISQQRLTVGLDLGDRNSWYCVLDEAGRIQLEQRVGTNAKALGEMVLRRSPSIAAQPR